MAILRGIGGVIAGYIVMFIVIFACFSGLWMVLGAEKSFQPNSWLASNTWVIAGMGIGLVAAILGGITCKLISASSTTVKVFAGIILVFGVAIAALGMTQVAPDESTTAIAEGEPDPNAPPAAPYPEVTMMEAMQYAKEPAITAWSNPIIGCVGVLIGGALVGRKKR